MYIHTPPYIMSALNIVIHQLCRQKLVNDIYNSLWPITFQDYKIKYIKDTYEQAENISNKYMNIYYNINSSLDDETSLIDLCNYGKISLPRYYKIRNFAEELSNMHWSIMEECNPDIKIDNNTLYQRSIKLRRIMKHL